VLVIAVQAWPRQAPAAAPQAPVPAAEGVDSLSDLTPVGEAVAVAGVDTTDTDSRIAFWQERLQTTPRSDTAWTYLGDLYDLKARQTGDISNYISARDAYQTALEIAPASAEAGLGIARISATLHDFESAMIAATAVLEQYPSADAALAIIFDAAYELGDLENAERAVALLDERVDSPALTVRQARLAFIHGDVAEARRLAVTAATEAETLAEIPASRAFFHYAAAEYALLDGDLDAAAAGYAAAHDALPGHALALAGQGRVAFARGDIDAAIESLQRAVAAVPRPDLVAYLGDLYALIGDQAAADDQYATVEFIAGLSAAGSDLVYDREFALFLSDHSRDAEQAVELASAELEQRQDVYGYDTLAWALHAAGRSDEALPYLEQALALGTPDARLLLHAGLIEITTGNVAAGRAHLEQGLALNPAFSPLVVEAAREALAE
jgi:tetratricopeptide (TPR) repeat protein